jgi:aminoglycoside/choline kinase family phosphotransferase
MNVLFKVMTIGDDIFPEGILLRVYEEDEKYYLTEIPHLARYLTKYDKKHFLKLDILDDFPIKTGF